MFLTSVLGRSKGPLERFVVAFDLETGELLWQTTVFTGRRGKKHHLNTHAAATPVTDGKSVFVAFDGHLAALDLEGNILWDKEIDPNYYRYDHYGLGSSPIVVDDMVVYMQDREEGDSEDAGWIAAFDKTTGEMVWRDAWVDTCCSYSTPVLARYGRSRELLTSASRVVRAYDPKTGERVWETWDASATQPVPSLLTSGDFIVSPGGVHKRQLFVLERTESAAGPEAKTVWSTAKQVPEIGSPIVYGDSLFSVTRGGVIVALRLDTGEQLWIRRLPTRAMYDPSLVAGDGKVYATTRTGHTTVVSVTGEQPQIMATNELGEGSGATPAIVDGSLLIRGNRHLFRIGGE